MKDVQGCRMVIRRSSESRQDLGLGSKRKERIEQLVDRGRFKKTFCLFSLSVWRS